MTSPQASRAACALYVHVRRCPCLSACACCGGTAACLRWWTIRPGRSGNVNDGEKFHESKRMCVARRGSSVVVSSIGRAQVLGLGSSREPWFGQRLRAHQLHGGGRRTGTQQGRPEPVLRLTA